MTSPDLTFRLAIVLAVVYVVGYAYFIAAGEFDVSPERLFMGGLTGLTIVLLLVSGWINRRGAGRRG